MIVNLAVADGNHAALRVRHWLVGLIRETTNGQTRRPEDRQVGVNLTGGVRATVRQGFEHCLHSNMSGSGRRELRKDYIATDATHSRTFSELLGTSIPRGKVLNRCAGRRGPSPRRKQQCYP